MSNFAESFDNEPQREILRAAGYFDEDIKKPFIGVISAYNPLMTGHRGLRELEAAVSRGIIDKGGTPVVLPLSSVCAGLANGHHGAKFSLPSRELTADAVETLAAAHALDGAVCLGSCGMTVAGMVLGLIRAGVPGLIVGNGSRCAGCAEGNCGGMPESMNLAVEALGLSLPGNSTLPGDTTERRALARRTGEAVMEAVKHQLAPRRVITLAALKNAIALNMAVLPSTDTLLHLLAIGRALGFNFEKFLKPEILNQISAKTPLLADVRVPLRALDAAGGTGAAIAALLAAKLLDGTALTATGKTLSKVYGKCEITNENVLHTPVNPYEKYGGLLILQGNLAENGAVVRRAGLDPMTVFSGPARVFDSVEDAALAASGGTLREGDVAVVRFEGPKGGPGMREITPFLAALKKAGLSGKVATVTDGRIAEGSEGLNVCHVSPEAYGSNPLAVLRDDDVVEIDLRKARISVKLSGKELEQRKRRLHVDEKDVSGVLRRYKDLAEDASLGAGTGE